MSASLAVSVTFQVVVGSVLLLFGWWGRTHAERLSPAALRADERERRTRVIVRGSWACQAAGVVFYLMTIPLFL